MSNRFSNDYKKGFVQGSRAGYKSGERIGGVAELEKLFNEIESDRKENVVWKEGSQYFENVLNKIEKRLAELKGKEAKQNERN